VTARDSPQPAVTGRLRRNPAAGRRRPPPAPEQRPLESGHGAADAIADRWTQPDAGIWESAASAAAYYKSTLLGDPVEVTGTKINLSPADGELFDWA